MERIEVDGHRYTKEDLIEIRKTVIGWRDESMNQWPEAIPFTTASTHLISILAQIIDQY